MLTITETLVQSLKFYSVKDGERIINAQPLTSRDEAEALIYKIKNPIPQIDRDIALRIKKSEFYLHFSPKYAMILQAYNQYSFLPTEEYISHVMGFFPEVGSDTLVNGKVQRAIEARLGYPDPSWITQMWVEQTKCYYGTMVPTAAIVVLDDNKNRYPSVAIGGCFASSAWLKQGHCNNIAGDKFRYIDLTDTSNTWICSKRDVRPMTQQEWDNIPDKLKREF